MKIKRQAVDLLVTNILKLNIKNLRNGIIRIKILKDDFDKDNKVSMLKDEELLCAGSKRDYSLK